MLFTRAGLILFVLFFAILANAAALPSFMREGSSRFLSRSLGSACYSMDSVQRALPCNPAAVAKERKPRFDGDLFLGSNIDYLKEAEDILAGESSEEEVATFFSRRESSQAEASVELAYQAPKWGASFEPYRVVLYSRFDNPALPMVDMIVAQEQSAKLQLASYVGENFYAGLQMRYSHVRYIGKFFSLTEAFTHQDDDFFDPETQDLIYLEPGFLYAWEELAWQPQISVAYMQWGWSDKKSEAYSIKPEGQVGASIKPLVPLGLLEVGLQFSLNSETRNAREAVRGAVAYQLGILQAVLSASDIDQSAGFLVGFKHFTSGLSYWREEDHQGVFVQFGVTL
ncbi:hypothetical protein [Bdellovibrio sp. HCB2-146]|uniref:hypothetical protein n=1 Tax=Bdellovibrio sp. HCB2-146 TaxID=3394362 RepID=UPI0039BC6CFD